MTGTDALRTTMAGLGVLRQPRTIVFGPGRRRLLPQLAAPLADSVLLCTDARMGATEQCGELVADLADHGIAVSVFDQTEPELPLASVREAQTRFGAQTFGAVIGLGGGSCLDMAKVLAMLLVNGGDVLDYAGEFQVPRPGVPVIAIPTTAGTGAEATCISVVYDPGREMKVGIASPHLQATAAIIDPELTYSCPPGLTAATGADALSHLIEAFTDRSKHPTPADFDRHLYVGKNDLTDIHCRTGLQLLNSSLERVMADPSDETARSQTMLAAWCGGVAINTAGTAAAHAIQTSVGALTHTPHGVGVGALLPWVMRFNLPAATPAFAQLGAIMAYVAPAAPEIEAAQAGITRVEELLAAIGIPTSLKQLGLNPEDFGAVAEHAMQATRLTANNPRTLTGPDIVALLERGYDADRQWWGR